MRRDDSPSWHLTRRGIDAKRRTPTQSDATTPLPRHHTRRGIDAKRRTPTKKPSDDSPSWPSHKTRDRRVARTADAKATRRLPFLGTSQSAARRSKAKRQQAKPQPRDNS